MSKMKILVVSLVDVRNEGVVAIVRIPEGKTAEETYKRWAEGFIKENNEGIEDEDDLMTMEQVEEFYPAEEEEVEEVW